MTGSDEPLRPPGNAVVSDPVSGPSSAPVSSIAPRGDPDGGPHASDPQVAEADRLIAAALADHVRMPAPARLREQLARRHLAPRPRRAPWIAPFALGAGLAAAIAVVVVRAPSSDTIVIDEAVGDHLRIVGAQHPLDVVASDMHQVKPWFTGRLDFVPPVAFLGDDEFRLRGGELAVFLHHKAAAFIYQRRLHTISLFVFADAAARPRVETTARGFHVISWATGGFGMALVSDIGWDDLRLLESRLDG